MNGFYNLFLPFLMKFRKTDPSLNPKGKWCSGINSFSVVEDKGINVILQRSRGIKDFIADISIFFFEPSRTLNRDFLAARETITPFASCLLRHFSPVPDPFSCIHNPWTLINGNPPGSSASAPKTSVRRSAQDAIPAWQSLLFAARFPLKSFSSPWFFFSPG